MTASILWRRALLRAALVPLVVLAPIVALAPTADHRFNIYWHGGLFRDDPGRIVPQTFASLDGYLRAGNFRPFGRILEKALDLFAYALGGLTGLPINVTLRLVSFGAAVLLGLAALLLAESVVTRGPLFRGPPSTLAAVVPFAVGAGLVAGGRSSPVVLFGGLYLTSAALVLVVVAAICRIGPDARLRIWWMPPLLAGGVALAVFNELAYLALPLATVAVAARGRWVHPQPWRALARGAPARALALLWLGFLPVFGVVRLYIANLCAGGGCYHASDVAAGPGVLPTFPVRLVAWFPPLMWQAATRGGGRLSGVVLLLAAVVLAALAFVALRDLGRLTPVGRRPAVALVVVAGALLVLGATMGSLSIDVQQLVAAHRWGQGWRDSALTMPAGGLLLAAAVPLLGPRRLLAAAMVVVLAAGAAGSATANKRFRDTVAGSAAARLDNRLAESMADFDPTPAGAARRCALRAEFFAMFADTPFSLRRFDQAFDAAARQRAGVAFCPGVTAARTGR